MVRGDLVQDLFGWGRLGSAYSFPIGPVQVWCRREDAEFARELLGDIASYTTPARPLWLRLLVWYVLLYMTWTLFAGLLNTAARR